MVSALSHSALSYDDILLTPAYSDFLPSEADTRTFVTSKIPLKIPVISSAMDTVTEYATAIAMAQIGGIGCIHKNMSIEAQVKQLYKVKRYEGIVIGDPITVGVNSKVGEVRDVMMKNGYSGIPVVEEETGKLCGIVTHRDVRLNRDPSVPVSDIMTPKERLITVREGIDGESAAELLHERRIERLLVVNDKFECVGLITFKDIEKSMEYPDASRDEKGRLMVACAVGVGDKEFIRASELIKAGVDLLVVDTAHGHSYAVLNMVAQLKKKYPNVQVVGGNIATGEAAEALIKAGADAVKVGVGPGSICTTRIVTGVGVPQFTAVSEVANACKGTSVRVIADGGIKYSGDIAKAIAAGADVVMLGSLLAGSDESPGDVIIRGGRTYKSYQGMGSIGAMKRGSSDRYFQSKYNSSQFVPEGIEGQVPHKGKLSAIVYQLIGGLKSAMGYTGNKTISQLQSNAKYVRMTVAGLRESHVHGVAVTQEAPNYSIEGMSGMNSSGTN